jgi:hypothetical protein
LNQFDRPNRKLQSSHIHELMNQVSRNWGWVDRWVGHHDLVTEVLRFISFSGARGLSTGEGEGTLHELPVDNWLGFRSGLGPLETTLLPISLCSLVLKRGLPPELVPGASRRMV